MNLNQFLIGIASSIMVIEIIIYILWSIQSIYEIIKCINYKCCPREGGMDMGIYYRISIYNIFYSEVNKNEESNN